ncbi:MAG: hypothetical protein WCF84_26765, partial [Anaerolineae bacterium]
GGPLLGDDPEEGICTQYQFQTSEEWVCDSWEAAPPETGAIPVVIVSDAGAAKTAEFELKFIGDGEEMVRGYEVIFGDPQHTDLSKKKDFFTPQTDFNTPPFPLPKPLTYHHGFDAKTREDPVIGSIVREGKDEWGIWFEAQLRKANAYDEYVKGMMREVKGLIKEKKLKPSSDAIPQYVDRVPQANGANWVRRWAIPSVSLTPVPAEPRMWAVSELKAAYKSIGVEFQLPDEQPEAGAEAGNRATAASDQGARTSNAEVKTAVTPQGSQSHGGIEMNEQDILALMEKREKEKEAKTKAEAEAKTADDQRIEAEVQRRTQAVLDVAAKTGRPPVFAGGGTSRITLRTKYDDMTLSDLAFLATLRGEAKALGRSKGPEETLLRALAVRSLSAIQKGELEAKALEDLFPEQAIEAKANEVMQSNLASYGDEWVPTNFSSQLWLKVRQKARLLQNGFIAEQEIPKGYESDTIPLESTDFTWYNVAQTTGDDSTMKTPVATVTSSKHGTAQRVVTVGKLGARGEISGELDEDSIIDALPNARRHLEADFPRELEFVLLNADTTAATDNINGDGTPDTTADYYTTLGIIRNALKNASAANAFDMGAAITSAKIVDSFYGLMGADGYLIFDDPTRVKVFCDYATWRSVLKLSDLLTVANAGDQATITKGADADGGIPIFNVKWYPSAGVQKALNTGIRSATPASNTHGRAVAVRGDRWIIRWKRRLKFETTRIARADVTEIVATARVGIGYFDNEASVIAYNTN